MVGKHAFAAVIFAALLLGCAAERDAAAGARPRRGADRLLVSVKSASNEGRAKKLSATVRNGFDQSVDGVRYVVTVVEPGPPPKILFHWQRQDDTILEPGETKEVSLLVENIRFGNTGTSRLKIDAQPVKLGNRDMPLPAEWQSQP